MTDDYEKPTMDELLPGRVPHELEELGISIFVDPDVSLDIAQHEAKHAKKHGCTCTTIVYMAEVQLEEDRVYKLLRAVHEDDCTYAMRFM